MRCKKRSFRTESRIGKRMTVISQLACLLFEFVPVYSAHFFRPYESIVGIHLYNMYYVSDHLTDC